MSIKRYIANADTTITNSFKMDLSTRGTGSNMGSADVVEIFSIYGQAFTGSTEISRALFKFPISDISTDRTNGNVPASGSVNFYLKLYNTRHASTVAKGFTIEVRPLTTDWEEGPGLDMEEYKDETYEGDGANWLFASSGNTWTLPGGDFKNEELGFGTSDNGNSGDRVYYQDFTNGTENLEINITEAVEEWIAGTTSNYGVILKLSGTHEPYFSSSTITETDGVITGDPNVNSRLHNLSGSKSSFYTKKFFARSSEYFLKRPCVEARWDSGKKDDRGNFYLSSSLAGEDDNVNTLYLYNYVRGQLKNIPAVGTGALYVTLHTGTVTGPGSGPPLELPRGGGRHAIGTFVTGGYSGDTGIYTASLATTASLEQDEYYYDIWHTGTEVAGTWPNVAMDTLFTGSAFIAKKFHEVGHNGDPSTSYVTSITNLKPIYSPSETARFRLYARKKDWCPTIYTKATSTPNSEIIEDAYYKTFRVVDSFEVVTYGTGSTTNAAPQVTGSAESYTRMSFDVSGNYFDLDMSLFETGYAYGMKFVYYYNGSYHEQPETFKFRVE